MARLARAAMQGGASRHTGQAGAQAGATIPISRDGDRLLRAWRRACGAPAGGRGRVPARPRTRPNPEAGPFVLALAAPGVRPRLVPPVQERPPVGRAFEQGRGRGQAVVPAFQMRPGARPKPVPRLRRQSRPHRLISTYRAAAIDHGHRREAALPRTRACRSGIVSSYLDAHCGCNNPPLWPGIPSASVCKGILAGGVTQSGAKSQTG
jgi:hypothetical protein